MRELLIGCSLGFLLGLRHALEPDHLAALSTLVTERPNARRAAGLGAAWGLGHTVALFLVALVLFPLRAQMSPRLADFFELVVAFVLLFLGARAIHGAISPSHHSPESHRHILFRHRHGDGPAHVHTRRLTIALRPFIVGVFHGLAGSGALTAIALAHMPTLSGALGYVAVFGVGSLVGMSLLSLAAGWPLAQVARSDRGRRALGLLAGALACVLGVAWGLPMAARLFAG